MDKEARPLPEDMKLWVDVIQFIKRYTSGQRVGFTFFTYMELSECSSVLSVLHIRTDWGTSSVVVLDVPSLQNRQIEMDFLQHAGLGSFE